jgi:hypothetical protein
MRHGSELNMADHPKYIEGIYNYCDRWCERCPLTSRCLNYAIAEENIQDLLAHDSKNQAFWDQLKDMFDVTIEMLTEWAEEQGIDLNTMDAEADTTAEQRRRVKAGNHELCQIARQYGAVVEQWFDDEERVLDQREESLNTIVSLGVGGEAPFEEAHSINDAIEVIHWYQHQIHVKFMRALTQTDAPDEAFAANGSVKVGLIGIDRSIAAWGSLRKFFPECADDILDILVILDRLRRKAEQVFPGARQFVRPGFDTLNELTSDELHNKRG